jgi:hypothetical protein
MSECRTQCISCGFDETIYSIEPGYFDDVVPVSVIRICERCEARVVARFDRNPAAGKETLREVFLLARGHLCESINESLYPDRSEFFHDRSVLPAARRMKQSYASLAATLRRVGAPVAYYDRELAEDGDLPFIVLQLNDNGAAVDFQVGADYLVEHPEVVCALDYRRDGTPLN